jgi:DNA polymerase-3 subunit delta'
MVGGRPGEGLTGMAAPENMRSFLGNPRVVQILQRALAQDRLPHALIFAGPAGIGKRALAVLLAQRLNCFNPQGEDACGTCRSCQKIRASSHPDVRIVTPDGAFIRIEGIRALLREIAFQPFEGKYRVVILDPAEQMKPETPHSLLKTLEEPVSRTFLILVTTNPYALLVTIRSRCRMLQFGRIPQQQIEEYLVAQEGRSKEEARLAADFSDGSLAAALSFDAKELSRQREQALGFVKLLLGRRGFTEISQLAAVVTKDKDGFPLWIDSVSALFKDLYFAQVEPDRIAQKDLAEEIRSLAVSASHAQVLSCIEGMNKLRRSLQQNVNRQIALESLYLSGGRDQGAGIRRN